MKSVSLVIVLLFGISVLAVVSNKYKFPFPIVLVLAGLLISLIPNIPPVSLSPDTVFLIFLPPLLFDSSWKTNWHHFKLNKKPIFLASFLLVILTTLFVGLTAHLLIPGITWSLGFLLGAIISPPDAVAAMSIINTLHLSPKFVSIIEGESLVNDASGLIAFKYAIMAVSVGNFLIWQAGTEFLLVVFGGTLVGLIIGCLAVLITNKTTIEPVVQVTITFLIPFTSYLVAEELHVSSVLAVVSTGLYLSYHAENIFTYKSRILTYGVWETVVFILNGLIFILIGLQLKSIINGIRVYSTFELFYYSLIITLVVIFIRFLSALPAALLPRLLNKNARENELFDLRQVIIFGMSGMRGIVSLAAALSIPYLLPDGDPFPQRNLIIFLTFSVIINSLLFLGLPLPWVIRKLNVPLYSVAKEEIDIRKTVLKSTLNHIDENITRIKTDHFHSLRNKYHLKYSYLHARELTSDSSLDNSKALELHHSSEFLMLQLDIISFERKLLLNLYHSGKASEPVYRIVEHEIDLEESRIRVEINL